MLDLHACFTGPRHRAGSSSTCSIAHPCNPADAVKFQYPRALVLSPQFFWAFTTGQAAQRAPQKTTGMPRPSAGPAPLSPSRSTALPPARRWDCWVGQKSGTPAAAAFYVRGVALCVCCFWGWWLVVFLFVCVCLCGSRCCCYYCCFRLVLLLRSLRCRWCRCWCLSSCYLLLAPWRPVLPVAGCQVPAPCCLVLVALVHLAPRPSAALSAALDPAARIGARLRRAAARAFAAPTPLPSGRR
jgi:hypothetical protein